MDFIHLLLSSYLLSVPLAQAYSNPTPSVLLNIAQCESHQQQFNAKGKVLRDYATGTHVGLYQISEDWVPTAEANGWDIYTPEGNVAMAVYLYNKQGTWPWKASSNCWEKLEGGVQS